LYAAFTFSIRHASSICGILIVPTATRLSAPQLHHLAPDSDQAVRDTMLLITTERAPPMTTLSISESGEISLTLRGAAENRILATMRRWPHWRRVALERDPVNAQQYLAVTLIADQAHESTVRDILQRSFGLTFPETGGSCELPLEPPPPLRRRGR
jgi:hypothetical protein